MEKLLNYTDICWTPNYSLLHSRDEGNTSIEFARHKWKVPVVPSNMETTISFDKARWMAENEYFYILHRFYSAQEIIKWVRYNQDIFVSISIGGGPEDHQILDSLRDVRMDCITIDLAHGYSVVMKEMVEYINNLYGKDKRPFIIAGNISGDEASIKFMEKLGVDAIKVGLAFGRACKTYNETGVGTPMISAGLTASSVSSLPLIGDGGIRERGDIIKGLIAGYDMLMAGSIFAACIDSPADIIDGKKMYYGSASELQRKRRGLEVKYVEGATVELPMNGLTYEQMLIRVEESIRSGISYAGGKDLSAFNNIYWDLCH